MMISQSFSRKLITGFALSALLVGSSLEASAVPRHRGGCSAAFKRVGTWVISKLGKNPSVTKINTTAAAVTTGTALTGAAAGAATASLCALNTPLCASVGALGALIFLSKKVTGETVRELLHFDEIAMFVTSVGLIFVLKNLQQSMTSEKIELLGQLTLVSLPLSVFVILMVNVLPVDWVRRDRIVDRIVTFLKCMGLYWFILGSFTEHLLWMKPLDSLGRLERHWRKDGDFRIVASIFPIYVLGKHLLVVTFKDVKHLINLLINEIKELTQNREFILLTRTPFGETECAICREDILGEQMAIALPCRHAFHKRCIRAVITYQTRCPSCRAENLTDEKIANVIFDPMALTVVGDNQ